MTEGAAPGRSYDNKYRLPWIDEKIQIQEKNRDFYENVADVLFDGATSYIPVEQTRELMRILEACREDAQF